MNFRQFIKSNPIVGLSPMDGITDEPFRLTQIHIAKPDVIFTEFVSAEGLAHNAVKLLDHLIYSKEEHPIIGQLFGKDPDSFYTATIILCQLGFDGIDINMGCPAKTVTQHGSGAALIGKPELASEIINAAKSAIADFSSGKTTLKSLKLKQKFLQAVDKNIKYSQYSPRAYQPTLSIKTRLGISASVIDTWIPHLLKHQPDFLTIHGRTLKQGYSGSADWSKIQKVTEIANNCGTLIWGNGDIQSRQQGIDYCQKYQVNGVLIGRAAMGNPWVFNEYLPIHRDKFRTAFYHAQIFKKVFPIRSIDCLRRHFLLYTASHPRAKSLRQQIIKCSSIADFQNLESAWIG